MFMFAVSQFYVLSPRGYTMLSRSYRDEMKATNDLFFRLVKCWNPDGDDLTKRIGSEEEEAPPCFQHDGITFIYIKQNGIYFVCTTRFNVSPNFFLELLCRLAKLFNDYCGTLNEEAIRKNYVMLYELVDEIIDYGLPQCTATEQLKAHVHTTPVIVDSIRNAASSKGPSSRQKTTPSSSADKPVIFFGQENSSSSNEIFVDICERVSMILGSDGYILSCSIDGSIQLKSFLIDNPPLQLVINPDSIIRKMGNDDTGLRGAGIMIDDCNFHSCVNLDDFDSQRVLNFVPPDGQFVLMNYRVTSEFMAPFHITPHLSELSSGEVELMVVIRADLPTTVYGNNVVATIPLPENINGVSFKLDEDHLHQTVEHCAKDRKVEWHIKKFQGGEELVLRVKISLKEPLSALTRQEIGPILLSFEIPTYSLSNFQVKYLRVVEHGRVYNPHRWVRYLTQSSSYVCRM